MGNHEKMTFKSENGCLHYCGICGLILVGEISKANCPPWQSTDKGDTKAERVGGDIHVLLQIQSSMREVKPLLAFKVNKEIAFRWNQAADALEQLIQKYETKNG